ncbi:hypothetical protein FOXG_00076 [Fusarium oxysporum f. sp. lycopersici 4287]|uniref:Uncharacterized protein n=2 Tax=Fusarium oxysporum TaxID=5507 RepID=A0A0J9U3W9_FUSO4|nr:hypothetical protein FOXG_00076 [Fusarium oxysporum f. sp. lycopersici 4287]KNA93624.1 hypothetical protein FOXG_00076 [Fusarium oxysporum f. sp. lycopersici 4287]
MTRVFDVELRTDRATQITPVPDVRGCRHPSPRHIGVS